MSHSLKPELESHFRHATLGAASASASASIGTLVALGRLIGRGSQAASNRHGLNSSLSLMAQEPRLWAVCLSAGGAVIPPVFGRRAPPTAGVLGGLSHR